MGTMAKTSWCHTERVAQPPGLVNVFQVFAKKIFGVLASKMTFWALAKNILWCSQQRRAWLVAVPYINKSLRPCQRSEMNSE